MDNQQLNPEQGRVQRSSRKRVLDEYFIWETPCSINKVYVYKLVSSLDMIPRYIGITSNPKERYNRHVRDKYLNHKSHKNNWIKSVINNNDVSCITKVCKNIRKHVNNKQFIYTEDMIQPL